MSWPVAGDKKFQPYDEVRDVVSGWKGKTIAEYRYHNGCLRYEVAGADKDGKPESFVFDEEQLELVARAAAPTAKRSGGDRSTTPVPR